MYTNTNYATVAVAAPQDEAKSYLLSRLHDLSFMKRKELQKHFQIGGIRPRTIKELKEWLKSGNYRVEQPKGYALEEQFYEDEEFGCFDNWRSFFAWGKEEPDVKAYDKAVKAMEEAEQDTKDFISVVTDEAKRLAKFEAFKDATFH